MTPFELGIMLHYYGSCAEHRLAEVAPIFPETINTFKMQGLLRDTTDAERVYGATVTVTERGSAFVESLMRVPLPELMWLAPDERAKLSPRRRP